MRQKPPLSSFSREVKIEIESLDQRISLDVPADLVEVLRYLSADGWIGILQSGAAVRINR